MKVQFEVRIITPFRGVTLEIGGAVETYWKSLATPFSHTQQKAHPQMAQPFRTIGSAHTSPSNYSFSGNGGHAITLSSLVGDYVHLPVQVTRDLQPVVFDRWRLPVSDFDLGVSDATFTQLQALSSRLGHNVDMRRHRASSPSEWHKELSGSLLPLQQLIKVEFSPSTTRVSGS